MAPQPKRTPAVLRLVYSFGQFERCAIIECPEKDRVIPIWLGEEIGDILTDLLEGRDFHVKRPLVEVLYEALEHYGGVKDIEIAVYVEGTYVAVANCKDGYHAEARPGDLLLMHLLHEVPLLVHEDVLRQGSVHVGDPGWRKVLQLTGPESLAVTSTSASGNEQADADFLQFMADMGVTEEELDLDGHADRGPEGS